MTQFHVFIRVYSICRFRIEVETDGGLRAAIEAARLRYAQSGIDRSAQLEIDIDDAEIFGIDESGAICGSTDYESVSASVGEPIDDAIRAGGGDLACALVGYHAVLPVKACARPDGRARERARTRGPDGSAAA